MRSFFVPGPYAENELVALPENEARHAEKVLRLKTGTEVAILDGQGNVAIGVFERNEGGSFVRIRKVRRAEAKRLKVELIQSQLKGPKMDWLVEKLTEIGVDAIHVIRSEFTVAQSDKADRWIRLSQAAMKQSGNPKLPEILAPAELKNALARLEQRKVLKVLLSPEAERGLYESIREAGSEGFESIVLAIGPEGGFSPTEESLFAEAGFIKAALSKNVLRGETAAITATSIAIHAIDF